MDLVTCAYISIQNVVPGRQGRHFSCQFPHIFPAISIQNGSSDMSMWISLPPARTKCGSRSWDLICVLLYALISVLSCVTSPMSSHMCALLCVLSYLCSPMCALMCVLSHVCSPMCALLCVLICMLSSVCSHMCALICVLSHVCSPVCAHMCSLTCVFS